MGTREIFPNHIPFKALFLWAFIRYHYAVWGLFVVLNIYFLDSFFRVLSQSQDDGNERNILVLIGEFGEKFGIIHNGTQIKNRGK